MRVHRRSAAVLATLLLTAVPASATVIDSALFDIAGEVGHQPNAPLLEFDVEDWAAFVRSPAPEYQLSTLGSGIDAFGGPGEFAIPPPHDLGDERMLTQIWDRP